MTKASVAPRLYEPSTLLEIQALQWHMRLYPSEERGPPTSCSLLVNFGIRITLRGCRDSLCGYIRIIGNNELQKGLSKKQGESVYEQCIR